jgi:hypothetical protein
MGSMMFPIIFSRFPTVHFWGVCYRYDNPCLCTYRYTYVIRIRICLVFVRYLWKCMHLDSQIKLYTIKQENLVSAYTVYSEHTYGILLVLTVLLAIVSCPGPRLSIGCFFLVGQFGAMPKWKHTRHQILHYCKKYIFCRGIDSFP